jgi:hypothetical protein
MGQALHHLIRPMSEDWLVFKGLKRALQPLRAYARCLSRVRRDEKPRAANHAGLIV